MSRVVLRDGHSGDWISFLNPFSRLMTRRPEEVIPVIRETEQRVLHSGLYAACFIAYEAAPAFDDCLPSKQDPDFPLIWCGLFHDIRRDPVLPDTSSSTAEILWRPEITMQDYRSRIQKIRHHIREGDTYQVNYTYRLRAKRAADPWDYFCGMLGSQPVPYAGFIDTGDWVICSASPELFFSLDQDRIESRPMKGTAGRGLWSEDDREHALALQASEKDRAENLMIVDMMRNDLGRVAEQGSVRVPVLFAVEQYSTVWQLTSTVTARTKAAITDILQAVFPPASITGAPRRRTMEIISALESSPRRIYTGSIGFMLPGRRMQFNVAIRTALFHRPGGTVEYGTGGGIVWDSDPEAEYQESVLKTRVLAARRPEFDLLETLRWSPVEDYFLLEYHLKRLCRSAQYFAFDIDPEKIRSHLSELSGRLPSCRHRIRLLVGRGGEVHTEVSELNDGDASFGDIAPAAEPVDREDPFLYHKTTHRRVYEKAVRGLPPGSDVLLYNRQGQITESTLANVAVEWEGSLFTPPVSCGLLPGTFRARMLERGLVRERIILMEDVLNCGEIYLMNAVRGMQKVRVTGKESKIQNPKSKI